MRAALVVPAVVMVLGALSPAGAQQKSAATLSGVVRDLAGAAVPNARVQVADHRRSANTDPDGSFTVRGLPVSDTLHVIVGRIGFRPVHLVLSLVPGDNVVAVELEPVAQTLDAMRTEVEQSGIFGVVGDTAFGIIAGARVTLTNRSSGDRLTNELGQFAMDTVKAGANMLEVRKPGFKPRLLSFMHPSKGGTRLAIWMTPLPPGASLKASELPNRTVQALFDYRGRTRWQNSGAAIITRELLTEYGTGMRLDQAIEQMPSQYVRGVRVRTFRVMVDGDTMPSMTLADFNADDVELVELYPPGTNFLAAVRSGRGMRRTNPPQSISRMRGAGAGAEIPPDPVGVAWIWLRR